MVAAGDSVPDFTLKTIDNEEFTRADLSGRRAVLCFFPAAFSPVCHDQLTLYQQVVDEFKRHGAELYGVSVDGRWALRAFGEQNGLTDVTLLSDFEPKGAVARLFGVYNERAGTSGRAVFVIEAGGTVSWATLMPTPTEFPGANEVFDALAAKTA